MNLLLQKHEIVQDGIFVLNIELQVVQQKPNQLSAFYFVFELLLHLSWRPTKASRTHPLQAHLLVNRERFARHGISKVARGLDELKKRKCIVLHMTTPPQQKEWFPNGTQTNRIQLTNPILNLTSRPKFHRCVSPVRVVRER